MGRVPPLLEALALVLLTASAFYYASQLATGVDVVINAQASTTAGLVKTNRVPEPFRTDAIHSYANADKFLSPLGDSTQNLFHFVQIVQVSDLHVSRYNKHGGHVHLLSFLKTALPMISPEFVVVTGDLTDAKDARKLTSAQYEDEWKAYHTALVDSGVADKNNGRFWWDQRGNHDCFNLANWQSKENHFLKYSTVKAAGYRFTYMRDFGTYLFVALDGCPERGPSRPFNFFGVLDTVDMDALQTAIQDVPANHTFVLSHYPLSTTLLGSTSDGVSFDALSRRISLYLCGHLHRLKGGIGDRMYGYKPTGFLELELADLKLHAMYRVLAVDNDLISFVDVEIPAPHIPQVMNQTLAATHFADMPVYDAAPVVLVTNPKDAHFYMPEREQINRVLSSTHVRALVFSQRPIKRVTGRFDNGEPVDFVKGKQTPAPKNSTSGSLPLWVVPWTPSSFNDKRRHKLVVEAEDVDGRKTQVKIRFRLDGRRLDLNGGMAEVIIMSDFPKLIHGVFVVGHLATCIGLLLLPRLWMLRLRSRSKYSRWKLRQSAILIDMDARACRGESGRIAQVFHDIRFSARATFLRLCNMTLISSVWWPLYLWLLVLITQPIFIAGNLIYSLPFHSQLFYIYGFWIEGAWQPLSDTWVFATFEVWNAFLPFTLFLSFKTSSPELFYSVHNTRRTWPIHRRAWTKAVAVLCVMYHAYNKAMLGVFYGWSGWLLSPVVWWTCWMSVTLWRWRWRGLVVHGTRRVVSVEADEREFAVQRSRDGASSPTPAGPLSHASKQD
ncbi:hypothetical protein RI367_003066 [Sorochytrium milnesiophthora]